ncbi:CHC2 zinc finger domain-containing protein [Saccharospirillum impatiens]|uniref:CHC2 zinc finger domain-containing protein n=1 Tax=Saccharospirillum impatiens TaxID=169438 RepID=UPI0003F53B20|nr:CHC2 zinc finger domain-containing protein [Saccharospirillum impatiens]
MARYSDETINRIKAQVSLVRLVEGSGVALKKQGADYVGHCPFHNDKTPSLVISPQKNLWHCLGACGIGGSVIDWVMKIQGVSFRHAVELLKNDIPSLVAGSAAMEATAKPLKRSSTPKLDAPVSVDADDQALLHQVIDYYHQTLKEDSEVLAYLQKRGLDDAALIERFRLGYANRTLGLRLPHKNRKAGAAIRSRLQRLGVFRESGHEHFTGSLVIPVTDAQGNITEAYGRKVRDNLNKASPLHTYLPGPHRGVFNVEGLADTEEVILCESLIDALTFWRWGFRHVTCSYGVNGFTDDLMQALLDHGIKRVLIAYDRDEAGNKAASTLAGKLMEQGLDCFRVLFPKGMDANQYATQMTPPQKALGLVLRKAEWLGNGQAPGLTTEPETAPITAKPLPSLVASLEAEPAPEPQPEQVAEPTPPEPSPETEPLLPEIDTQASPVPPSPQADIEVEVKDHELFITRGTRIYRVRGLEQNPSGRYDQLKIQLMVTSTESDLFHMDKLDLYSSKQRQVFINQASGELGVADEVIKKDLAKVLLTLEDQLAKRDEDATDKAARPDELSTEERQTALDLLQAPDLLDRVLVDFERAGVVGEDINKLTGYLACTSRRMERPLAVIIQSSSAAGKSSLMDAILALMPEEDRVQYSAMTGQSLFYMGETNLKHKILAISEEEGAHNASYALKLLQSEGEVTIASTGKDDNTGQLVTREYKVEGPVMLFLTTTAIDIDEELLNRCVVLTVNESREQTQAIHRAQRARRTLEGLQLKQQKQHVLKVHHNVQRLLKPLAVINPYADQLTFLDDKTRTRRDHEKYLTLIDSIALLHQYQRDTKHLPSSDPTEPGLDYIEVTLDDIATANRLAHEVLGKTLDELPPQTRRLLREIQRMVAEACQRDGIEQRDYRFSRKRIREATGWGNTQLKIHCKRLEDMEYLLVHRGGRGQSFDYELLYDAPDTDEDGGQQHLMGLIDPERLRQRGSTGEKHDYDANRSGSGKSQSGPSRPQVGGVSGSENDGKASAQAGCGEQQFDFVANTYKACHSSDPSYLHETATPSSLAAPLVATAADRRQ